MSKCIDVARSQGPHCEKKQTDIENEGSQGRTQGGWMNWKDQYNHMILRVSCPQKGPEATTSY